MQEWIDPKGLAVFAIPLIVPELIALGKAALVTLGIGIIYEKGKKAWRFRHSRHLKDRCNRKK